jgi:YidC/Oxa1 family membrane protein insertase
MDKQTTIAFILIGAILVLWLYISSPDPKQQPKAKDTTTLQDSSKQVAKQKDSVDSKDSKILETETLNLTDSQTPEEFVYIETELARFELSNKGGKL